ncbi:MAG: hypothetical protein CVU31_08010 [Betaproteobacteria bacterium HGW-Betaproteobacteria-4]|nr:MAG: hypothetical protein CVU31_08010 [Betaproteobacteria bacterium HGW-Betaproteobacteria-4]
MGTGRENSKAAIVESRHHSSQPADLINPSKNPKRRKQRSPARHHKYSEGIFSHSARQRLS